MKRFSDFCICDRGGFAIEYILLITGFVALIYAALSSDAYHQAEQALWERFFTSAESKSRS